MIHWSDIYNSYDDYLAERQIDYGRDLKRAKGIMLGLVISVPFWVLLNWVVL